MGVSTSAPKNEEVSGSDNSDDENGAEKNGDSGDIAVKHEVPQTGNTNVPQDLWTDWERQELDKNLIAFARWTVHYEKQEVRSTQCTRLTENKSCVCDECNKLLQDSSLKDALYRVRTVCLIYLSRQTNILQIHTED